MERSRGRTPSPESRVNSASNLLSYCRHSGNVSLAHAYVLDAVTALYMLYTGLLYIPLTDIMLKKSCYIELKYNETICQALEKEENHQYLNEVERVTKYYGLASNIAASLPAVFTTIIASNYITHFGMKVPVICAILGTGTTCLLQLYSFFQMDLPLYFNVVFQLPQALAGGLLVVLTAAQTRITLITPPERRNSRLFVLRFFLLISNLIAVAVGTPIYKNLGPTYLAAVLIASLVAPLLLMIFVFRDRGVDSNANPCAALKASANFTSLKDGLRCMKRERQGHARAQIYLMLISLTIANIPYAGTDNLEQLYVYRLYGWDASFFATIASYSLVALTVASVIVFLLFTMVLHLSEPILMLISYSFYTAKVFSKSLMFLGKFMFWIQLALGTPLSIGTAAASSHLTRLVAPSETAVIFGLSSSLERVVPLFIDIAFSAIYAASIETFPGMVFLFEGLIFLLPTIFAAFCAHWVRSEGYPKYEKLDDEVRAEI